MGRLIEQSLAIAQQIRVLSYFDFSLSQHVNIANYKESKEGIKIIYLPKIMHFQTG